MASGASFTRKAGIAPSDSLSVRQACQHFDPVARLRKRFPEHDKAPGWASVSTRSPFQAAAGSPASRLAVNETASGRTEPGSLI